jgi:hypothetical protein
MVLVLVSMAGCHRSTDAFRLTDQRMQNLLRQGSAATSCPAVAMTSERISDRVFRVSGCGTFADFGAFTRGRGRYQSARWVRITSILERASSELGCAVPGTAVTMVGALRAVVNGCGRVATYDLQCGDVDCGWVMTSGQRAPTPAPVVAQVAIPAPSMGITSSIQTARASVLACTSGQPVDLQIAWNGAAHMTLSASAPFTGMSAEGCIASALTAAGIVLPSTPGSVIVRVQ